MIIGIDISQIVYEGTGVSRYIKELVRSLLSQDKTNTYILFGSSLRQGVRFQTYMDELTSVHKNVSLKLYPFPPVVLDILWNRLHILPIEWLIGNVDVFWSSDWTQPPLGKAKGITTIHDLIVYTYPNETHNVTSVHISGFQLRANIVETQKRRLKWATQECQAFLCDSQATKQDAVELLHIHPDKLHVVYPGFH